VQRFAIVVALAGGLAFGGACSGDDSGGSDSGASDDGGSGSSTSTAAEPEYYVSLGDSYASGYQPNPEGGPGANTDDGFAYQVPGIAAEAGYDLELVNFGCGGATTTSILESPGCPQGALGPDADSYDGESQADAAEGFLEEHQGEVALITVSIGGNDVTSCAAEPDAVGCVATAVEGIEANLSELMPRLRAAAGPDTVIVGITYPDVILGGYLSDDPGVQQLAQLSIIAFEDFINPALQQQYEAVDGVFVDVTAATGAYGPFDETTTLEPYGEIPVPVAQVCELTWYCEFQDIHARTPGYRLIAELVVDAFVETTPIPAS
jgi:lysophospholipase L1-like esterase